MSYSNARSLLLSSLGVVVATTLPMTGCGGSDETQSSSDGDLQSSSAELRGLGGTSSKPERHCAPKGPLVEPTVPTDLSVPATATLVARYRGVGSQIYTCSPNPNAATDGNADVWTFKAPSATLYNAHCCVAGTHFAGPTWQSVDGSTIVASKVASAASPNADSIPILLLKAVSNTGSGIFSNVTFVQRLDTVGGVAPTGACDNEGAELDVPYEANYYFYTGGN
jgi:hypothetical protein